MNLEKKLKSDRDKKQDIQSIKIQNYSSILLV